MQSRTFSSGRIRRADYDAASRQLSLHWDDKTVRTYNHVPAEVFRRLCSVPNPTTYWEDRIAEEYPKGAPITRNAGNAVVDPAQKLRDLFGKEN